MTPNSRCSKEAKGMGSSSLSRSQATKQRSYRKLEVQLLLWLCYLGSASRVFKWPTCVVLEHGPIFWSAANWCETISGSHFAFLKHKGLRKMTSANLLLHHFHKRSSRILNHFLGRNPNVLVVSGFHRFLPLSSMKLSICPPRHHRNCSVQRHLWRSSPRPPHLCQHSVPWTSIHSWVSSSSKSFVWKAAGSSK